MLTVGCAQPTRQSFLSETPLETQVSSHKLKQVLQAAIAQTTYTHGYDPAYVEITYSGEDVPLEKGGCTDVVIRAFRTINVDLQQDRATAHVS